MIRRRHVFYIAGYDPILPAAQYQRFRRELAVHARLWDIKAAASATDETGARWDVWTRSCDWQVQTTYELLSWDDIVRADFERDTVSRLARATLAFLSFLVTGTIFRYVRARFVAGLYFLYPYLYVIGFALTGLFAARVAAGFLPLPAPVGFVFEGAVALGLFALLLHVQGEKRRVQHALDNCIFADEFLDGRRSDMKARTRAFAQRVVQTVRDGSADEVLVVGHSLGATLAVQVLAQALAIDPALARRDASVGLLTAGSTLPKFTLDPRGNAIREDVARLTRSKELTWVDVQASLDYMSFYGTDPLGAKLERGRNNNPRIVEAMLSDMIDMHTLWRRPWQTIWNYSQRLMRLHYQTVLANKRRTSYDYYAIVCGPLPLRCAANETVVLTEGRASSAS